MQLTGISTNLLTANVEFLAKIPKVSTGFIMGVLKEMEVDVVDD